MSFIHREGYMTLGLTLGIIIVGHLIVFTVAPVYVPLFSLFSLFILFFFLQFFRNPKRVIPISGEHLVYAPADGEVVVVEKTFEKEFFKEERIQISIFMSPVNVHVNRSPISGTVEYYKYHPGKYLVAWHPKSSELNERTTFVIKGEVETLLVRQIAGMVARRIKFYPKEGDEVNQGDEIGFIKFGSRVDVFLPLNADVLVKKGDRVLGNEHILANLKSTG